MAGAPKETPRPDSASSDKVRARRLAREARTAYEAGNFERAEGLIRGAYALDPAPVLLYNLAEILDARGDTEGAQRTYRRYLQLVPNAPSRRRIERRIEVLQKLATPPPLPAAPPPSPRRRASAQPSARTAPPAATETAVEPEGPRVLPWVVVGIGALTVGAGGVLGFLAQDKEQQARDEPEQIAAENALSDGEDFALAANALYIGGGALVAGGLLWAILGGDADDPAPVGFTVTTNSIVAVGRF